MHIIYGGIGVATYVEVPPTTPDGIAVKYFQDLVRRYVVTWDPEGTGVRYIFGVYRNLRTMQTVCETLGDFKPACLLVGGGLLAYKIYKDGKALGGH